MKRGFTLAELMLVIAMIAVLAVTTVNVLLAAQEESRAGATEALIVKIDNLLDQRKSHYDTRRLPVVLSNYSNDVDTLRTLRQMILMDIVQVEMPVDSTKVAQFTVAADYPSAEFRAAITTLEGSGDLIFDVGTSADLITELELRRNRPALSSRFVTGQEASEYLYGIIATTDMNASSGLDLLGNSAFGNADNDGFFEIVDAWGDPMTLEILDPTGNPMNIATPVDVYNLTFRVRSINMK